MLARDIQSFKFLKHHVTPDLLHPKLVSSLTNIGITHFTDIQQQALPTLLEGKTALI